MSMKWLKSIYIQMVDNLDHGALRQNAPLHSSSRQLTLGKYAQQTLSPRDNLPQETSSFDTILLFDYNMLFLMNYPTFPCNLNQVLFNSCYLQRSRLN